MRVSWRHRLALLVASGVALLGFATANLATGTALAACPEGTNWDNVAHACR